MPVHGAKCKITRRTRKIGNKIKGKRINKENKGGIKMEAIKAFSETPILYGDDAKALIRDVMRKPNPKVVERNRYLARMVRELKSEAHRNK